MQGIFNARMSDAIGGWNITSMVHLVAFTMTLTIYMKVRDARGKYLTNLMKLAEWIGTDKKVFTTF